jgi:spore coat protein U-like protein
MRKIILAGAAMLATTGMAMAAGDSFTISAPVTAKCTVTKPGDINFNNDSTRDDEQTGSFSFSCNFAGTNGTGANALRLRFQSEKGGLVNPLDSSSVTNPKTYGFTYEGNTEVLSSDATFKGTGFPYPETSVAAGAVNNRDFVVRLEDELLIAGTYSDTINVTVSP